MVRERDGAGRLISRSAATVGEARAIQAELRTTRAAGKRVARLRSFADYSDEWLDSYAGRTGRGFREATRDGYRAALAKHAKPFFGRMTLTQIQPSDIKAFAKHLTDKDLSPASVRRYVAPVKAMLATAFEDGVIPNNPATNVRIAVPREHPDDDHAKSLSDAELARLIDVVDVEWRPFIELLSLTGLRIGEAVALQWGDIDLSARVLRVRRAAYKGRHRPAQDATRQARDPAIATSGRDTGRTSRARTRG